MKTRTKHIAGAISASALLLGLLAASQTANAASEGIANTRHNLGTNGQALTSVGTRTGSAGLGDVFTLGTDEICVFCHTPHGANTTVPVPLWNKASLASTVYTTFTSGTMNGTAPTNLAGHMSLACLSCHDGTQAMDNMVNQPGQGGFNKQTYLNGGRLGQATNGTGVVTGTQAAWFAGNNDIAAGDGQDNQSGNADVSNGMLQSGAGVDYIGTDLSNDHPIGMAYAGGGCSAAGAKTNCSDQDFNQPEVGLGGMYQVGSATAGVKTAMRLYGTDLTSATVECASCHDPHSDAANTFLRTSNAASGVCLTCHTK